MSLWLRLRRNALYPFLACLPFVAAPESALADTTGAADEAPQEQRTIGFSNLVLRPGDKSQLATGNEELRVRLIEHLRSRGLNAMGAESLVFGKDRTSEAELLLGGTVSELDCVETPGARTVDCLIAVDWELLDARSDAVVYSLKAYHSVHGATVGSNDTIADTLLFGALDSLIRRPHFQNELREKAPTSGQRSAYEDATFPPCAAPERSLPTEAEKSLDSVVLVETQGGFGSGFFFSEAPFVLTAAHVVEGGGLRVKLRNGQESGATVVRVDSKADVALLRLTDQVVRPACTPLSTSGSPAVGAPVYVMGSPAAKELAFSLTQGIVSSVRLIDGAPVLQTDAPINPGNSGGPLVDARGNAVAIASFKLSGVSVEGVAFGIPVPHALARLAISPGVELSSSLVTKDNRAVPQGAPVAFVDTPDVRPQLNPAALEARRRNEKRTLTNRPGYVGLLRWGGLAAGVAGAALITNTWLEYDSESMSASDYESALRMNDLGWVALALGTTAFVLSFPLDPTDDENESTTGAAPRARHTARAELGAGPGKLTLKLSF